MFSNGAGIKEGNTPETATNIGETSQLQMQSFIRNQDLNADADNSNTIEKFGQDETIEEDQSRQRSFSQSMSRDDDEEREGFVEPASETRMTGVPNASFLANEVPGQPLETIPVPDPGFAHFPR